MKIIYIFFTMIIQTQIKPSLLLDLGPLTTSENYGPYEIIMSHYELCKGPKLKNVATSDMEISKDNITGDYIFRSNLTFLENTEFNEIKVKTLILRGNNKKKTVMSYRIDKPCEHFVIASLLEKHLNAKNCIVKKGTYSFALNYSESFKAFFGESFFYGVYQFKAVSTSKKGNISCVLINPILQKKNVNKKTNSK